MSGRVTVGADVLAELTEGEITTALWGGLTIAEILGIRREAAASAEAGWPTRRQPPVRIIEVKGY